MTIEQLRKWNVVLTIVVVLLVLWSIYAAVRLYGGLEHLTELGAWLNKVATYIAPHDGTVGNPPPPPPKLF